MEGELGALLGHLGRFAQQYRNQHDELPSTTLSTSRRVRVHAGTDAGTGGAHPT